MILEALAGIFKFCIYAAMVAVVLWAIIMTVIAGIGLLGLVIAGVIISIRTTFLRVRQWLLGLFRRAIRAAP
jgi:hypothetical protein